MDPDESLKKAKTGSFQAMGLDKDLFKGLNRMGYKIPTPVQRKALPIVLAGMDCVCMARTGSGKTCVFLLPMIEKLLTHNSSSGVRGIVLSPTRELAKQTFKFARDMAKFSTLRIISICGGDPIEAQFEALADRPDIIIATPGRLMHLLREISTFKLKHVQYLVFDEADRLFEMGFAEQLNEIVRECPQERQTLLFSATMPAQLVQFSRAGLRDPQLIRLDTDTKMSDELRMAFFCIRSNEKVAALLYLVRQIIPSNQLTIIFTATKHHSEFLHTLFEKIGLRSTLVYGSMDQDARALNLRSFRNGEVNFMIVTDLAARGIDVPLLDNVINFHFPASPKLFVHRCGRAARQGRIGFAFSLVEPEEFAYMADIHSFLSRDVDTAEPPTAPYTLTSMKPSSIHTGVFPQDILAEELDSLDSMIAESDELRIMWRICENGMKQYRRTRTEATKTGIKIAKNISKKELIRSIHPLIAGMDPDRCSSDVILKANFIKHLQSFRPAQTVFESGIGTGTQMGGSKVRKKGGGESFGVEIMRALRKEVGPALERNKKSLPLGGNSHADDSGSEGSDEEELQNQDEGQGEGVEDGDSDDGVASNDEYVDGEEEEEKQERQREKEGAQPSTEALTGHGKKRVSRAERRKIKKGGPADTVADQSLPSYVSDFIVEDETEQGNAKRQKTSKTFIDPRFYMTYGTEDENAHFVENSMQPQSGLKSHETSGAQMLENAMLDVAPDDAMEMNKKKKLLRWDANKRKFVKQSLEEMMQSKKGVKKIRTESGVILSKSSKPQGEMYNNWKKKTRREITIGGAGDTQDDRPRPNFRFNSKVPDELKSAHDIRAIQKKRGDNKLKNMKKDKRKSIEGNTRKKKAEEMKNGLRGTKAGNRKVRAVLRY